MFIFGVIFALVAGILFGLIGPTTKIAYNFGASASLAILFRYVVATIFILPFIPFQKSLLKTYQKNIISFLLISLGSILLTLNFNRGGLAQDSSRQLSRSDKFLSFLK